jgi:hypothetical protein
MPKMPCKMFSWAWSARDYLPQVVNWRAYLFTALRRVIV